MKHARGDEQATGPARIAVPFWNPPGSRCFGRELPRRGEDGHAIGGDPWWSAPLPHGAAGWRFGGVAPACLLTLWEDDARTAAGTIIDQPAAAMRDYLFRAWMRYAAGCGLWRPGPTPPPPQAWPDGEEAEQRERFGEACAWIVGHRDRLSLDLLARASEAGLLPRLPDPLRQDYLRWRATALGAA